jgi:hypothetical protein
MTDIPSSSGRPRIIAVVMALVVVCSLFSLPVSAAGSTAVELSPGEATVDIGNTTTFDIVVTNADGGVGAYELTVEINDPDTAQITDVTRLGDPGIGTADIASDGASADVESGLMDTADTGSVTIARVTIEGEANGTSTIQLAVQALGDEAGASYDVTETRDATLTVGSGSTTTDTESTSQPATTENDAGGGPGSSPGTESAPATAETTAASADAQATTGDTEATSTSQSTAASENNQDQSSPSEGSTATETSDATTGPATQSSSDSTEIPGFGVLTGLSALGTLIVIVRIRLRQ